MSDVANTCLDIQGKAPCKFALIGMGSLARKEVTPYSDFECAILLQEGVQNQLNYEDILEYFRWFAVIFQIILISLGETILPSVAIPGLNDFSKKGGDWFYDDITPSGISFDGSMPHACKTPLGRQEPTKKKPWKTELIKPISEMLQYLSTEADLKNGYHLADILSATCFVYGDSSLHDEFSSRVNLTRKEERRKYFSRFIQRYFEQLGDDLVKFDLLQASEQILIFDKVKIKSVFYRSLTIFIAALGKIHECVSLSSFGIVSELRYKKKIPNDIEHKLKYAVAISCEARLKIYSIEQHQADEVEGSLNAICDAVGEKCVVDYLTITSCFQKAISWFDPAASSSNIIFTKESRVQLDLFLVLQLYIKIDELKELDDFNEMLLYPGFTECFIVFAFYDEQNAINELANIVQQNVDYHLGFKQRRRFKLRKRSYNYISAIRIAKEILILKRTRQIYWQFMQIVINMWGQFCDEFKENKSLNKMLLLEKDFIRTDLKQLVFHLMTIGRKFKKTHLKCGKCSTFFAAIFYLFALFKFFRALQNMHLACNDEIVNLRITHKKIRSARCSIRRNPAH